MEVYVSAACCHMANVSHRLGKSSSPDSISGTIKTNSELADAFERCRDYLGKNGVDLNTHQGYPRTLGHVRFQATEVRPGLRGGR